MKWRTVRGTVTRLLYHEVVQMSRTGVAMVMVSRK